MLKGLLKDFKAQPEQIGQISLGYLSRNPKLRCSCIVFFFPPNTLSNFIQIKTLCYYFKKKDTHTHTHAHTQNATNIPISISI